jgi:capsular exopolysaccharide synthesis family protein
VGTVLAALRRRPFHVAGIFLLAGLAAFVVWKKTPDPKNTGYALFQLHANQPHILTPQEREDTAQAFRMSQGALVKSRHILNAALKDTKVSNSKMLKDEADKVTELEGLVKVDYRAGPQFMRVSVEGDDADELRAIIDAIAKAYTDQMDTSQRTEQQNRRVKLEERELSLKSEIDNHLKTLNRLLDAESERSNPSARLDLVTRRSQLALQKNEAETLLRQAEIELDLLQNANRSRSASDVTALEADRARLLNADPNYRELAQRRESLRALVRDTRKAMAAGAINAGLTAAENDMADLERQCRDIENRVQAQAEDIASKSAEQTRAAAIRQAETQKARAERNLASLEKALKDLHREDQRSTMGLTDGPQMALERDRRLLSQVQEKLAVLQMEADAPSRVVKLESDVLPGVENGKRRKLTLGAGIGFIVVGLAGLVFLDRRNPVVLTTQQVTDQLRLPLLGVVPALQDNTKSATATGSSDWQIAAMEAVSGTRTLLQYGVSQAAQQARVILVGSAVSGEGKSSLSLLLARSLSQAGNRTLLIDGDLRRPVLHSQFAVPGSPGLCEYLTGAAEMSDICRTSHCPDLTIIPAGVWSDAATQALAGPHRWPDLIRSMTVEYDYVLIDSAPILPVTDALLMSRAVDGVLLSVMREVSEVNAVKDALAQLALIGTRVLGVVVNGGPVRRYYRSREEAPISDTPVVTLTSSIAS